MALRFICDLDGRALRVRRLTASLSEDPAAAAAVPGVPDCLGGAVVAGRRAEPAADAPSASSAADDEPLSTPVGTDGTVGGQRKGKGIGSRAERRAYVSQRMARNEGSLILTM